MKQSTDLAPKKTHDVTTLPRWAQTQLTNQDREIDRLRTALAEARGEAESPVVWAQGFVPRREFPIPEHSDVEFWQSREKREYLTARLCQSDPLAIEVHSPRALLVIPVASNRIKVEFLRDWR